MTQEENFDQNLKEHVVSPGSAQGQAQGLGRELGLGAKRGWREPVHRSVVESASLSPVAPSPLPPGPTEEPRFSEIENRSSESTRGHLSTSFYSPEFKCRPTGSQRPRERVREPRGSRNKGWSGCSAGSCHPWYRKS